jgi:hypothetical protein
MSSGFVENPYNQLDKEKLHYRKRAAHPMLTERRINDNQRKIVGSY